MVWRQTANQRMVAKLKQIKQTLRRRMHEPLDQIGAWLRSVSQGFYQYHAVPGNLRVLSTFRHRLRWLWRSTLRHRRQRPNVGWQHIGPLFDAGCLHHAFCILTPAIASTPLIRDRSRMREFCTYGSVRGGAG